MSEPTLSTIINELLMEAFDNRTLFFFLGQRPLIQFI